jgi:hypothetical protein
LLLAARGFPVPKVLLSRVFLVTSCHTPLTIAVDLHVVRTLLAHALHCWLLANDDMQGDTQQFSLFANREIFFS